MDACPLCARTDPAPNRVHFDVTICDACRVGYVARRTFAWLIDWALLIVILALPAILHRLVPAMPRSIGFNAAVLVLGLLAFSLRDALGGRSPGKALCGLRVIDRTTRRPIGARAALLRQLPVTGLLALVGLSQLTPVPTRWTAMAVTLVLVLMRMQMGGGERCGDRFAGTMVVLDRQHDRPPYAAPCGDRAVPH